MNTEFTSPQRQFTPKYYQRLYTAMLREIQSGIDLNIPKWKKDVLLILLEKSKEKRPPTRQELRKRVSEDVKKAKDVVWKRHYNHPEGEE